MISHLKLWVFWRDRKLELQDQLNAQEVVVQQLKARTEDLESRGPNLNDAGRDTIRELDKQCLGQSKHLTLLLLSCSLQFCIYFRLYNHHC